MTSISNSISQIEATRQGGEQCHHKQFNLQNYSNMCQTCVIRMLANGRIFSIKTQTLAKASLQTFGSISLSSAIKVLI